MFCCGLLDKTIFVWVWFLDLKIKLYIMPRIKLDKIWDAYIITPSLKLDSMPTPTAPITKIGPEVVQNKLIRFASSSLIKCLLYRSAIIFAPIG